MGAPGKGGCAGGGRRGAESGKNRGELCNIVQYFAIEKEQKGRSQQKLGTEMMGGGKFEPPYPPPLLPSTKAEDCACIL